LKLCEKMARLDPKRFAESQPKKDTSWKETGSQEARQRPQVKQKEEKKVAALLPRRSWVNSAGAGC
jgi:elongation factor 1-gamma